ncbi:NACHT-domain-containing protein [Penicillium capsulatum]|uniref:NACHT-domain-containing protein n=1 Tax=Penicillium capsulatum TaxID=69766 RepID=A0A9W9I9M8_9EURO|nr:NACHT-domain-containing protein [Penicillium capsulatum]
MGADNSLGSRLKRAFGKKEKPAEDATRRSAATDKLRSDGRRIVGGTADVSDNPAISTSLWDQAYDSLKKEQSDLISAYEDLLSRALHHDNTSSGEPNQADDSHSVANRIPQDPVKRREILNEIAERGLVHMEDRKTRVTMMGHQIKIEDAMAKFAGAVEWAETYVKDAIKDVPYAPAVMAGISLTLPLFKNPAVVDEANKSGFSYVTSQMRYYSEMEMLLLPEDMAPSLRADLTERLINFYTVIIEFQISSTLRFYQNGTTNYFREVLEKKLGLNIASENRQQLKKLADDAKLSRQNLSHILRGIHDLVSVSRDQRDILARDDQRQSNKEEQTYRAALHATDPSLDKKRILLEKDDLLRDSFAWVLDNPQFLQWRNDTDARLLWINGDPGKGKTMLLCGIIDELGSCKTEDPVNLSFFFCQATDPRINSASSVLRGLIFSLLDDQPSLLVHVREFCDTSGKEQLEGPNSWVALGQIFLNMLKDPLMTATCFVVDALDECVTDLGHLLDLITKHGLAHSHVKWIVSSRKWSNIESSFKTVKNITLNLESNEQGVTEAVTRFIEYKVDIIAAKNDYDEETRSNVLRHLTENCDGTFLWVALVCKELGNAPVWRAEELSSSFPPGLGPFYERMLDQVRRSKDPHLSKNILAVVTLAFQPLTVDELPSVVDKASSIPQRHRRRALADALGSCGSFVTLRGSTIIFIHQSAQDFLLSDTASNEIFPHGTSHVHYTMFASSLDTMSKTLRRDIYNLKNPGVSANDVHFDGKPEQDPLASLRYSCSHFLNHLRESLGDFLITSKENVGPGEAVCRFLNEHFLHWVEARSLAGTSSLWHDLEGLLRTSWIQGMFKGDLKNLGEMYSCVRAHRYTIENFPLQTYLSVILFSPVKSTIRNQLRGVEPGWLLTSPIMSGIWSPCQNVFRGHRKPLCQIVPADNSRSLASVSTDGTVHIWNWMTGSGESALTNSHEIALPRGSLAVAWLPDRTGLLMCWLESLTIQLWIFATDRCEYVYENTSVDKAAYHMVAWSGDGRLAAVVHQTMQIWDHQIRQFTVLGDAPDPFAQIAWSQCNRFVSASSASETVVWEVATRKVTNTIPMPDLLHCTSAAWSTGGQLAISGFLPIVFLWDSEKGSRTLAVGDEDTKIRWVSWKADSHWLILAKMSGLVEVWDCSMKMRLFVIQAHESPVGFVTWLPDKEYFASGSENGTVKIWRAWEASFQPPPASRSEKTRLALWAEDGARLVSTSMSGTMKVWDGVDGKYLSSLEGIKRHRASHLSELLHWFPDMTKIISATEYGAVQIWDTHTSQLVTSFESNGADLRAIALSPDGSQLACAFQDASVKIRDLKSGKWTSTLHNSFEIWSLAWAPDGLQLALCSPWGQPESWRPADWDESTTVAHSHTRGTASESSMVWSEDGTHYALILSSGDASIWESSTQLQICTFRLPFARLKRLSKIDGFWRLHTSYGAYQVRHSTQSSGELSATSIETSVDAIGYGVNDTRTWITYDGENLIFIPHDYSGGQCDVNAC